MANLLLELLIGHLKTKSIAVYQCENVHHNVAFIEIRGEVAKSVWIIIALTRTDQFFLHSRFTAQSILKPAHPYTRSTT